MNKFSLLDYWSEISLALGGIVAFFTGRKMKKNEESSGELQNIEKVREIEKQLLEDMEEQIIRLMDNNNKLELIIEKQSKKIRAYEKKFGMIEKNGSNT